MKKVLLPGLVAAVATILVSMLVGWLFGAIDPSMEEAYKNTTIFRPMDDPLMFGFFLQPFYACIIFAWVWNKFKEHFQGSLFNRGLMFGFTLWLVATIPGMIMSFCGFNISFFMVLSWTISNLATYIVSGWIFAGMNK